MWVNGNQESVILTTESVILAAKSVILALRKCNFGFIIWLAEWLAGRLAARLAGWRGGSMVTKKV